MPVEGDSSARSATSSGSSARASAPVEPRQIRHAVGLGLRLDRRELADLGLVDRDDQLAAAT